MRRVVGAKLLRANGRKTPPCVFPLPARFFCCQPRCFVRQHPPVCRFSPRISAPSAFLLLRNCVSSAAQPRFFCCATALSVRHHPLSRLFFLIGRRERLCFAKYPCPPARAPRRYRARGDNCFWLFSRLFPARCAFFLLTSAVFSRSDAEFSCRCAGFSVRRGCASLALMQVFATSCGALGASRSAFAV